MASPYYQAQGQPEVFTLGGGQLQYAPDYVPEMANRNMVPLSWFSQYPITGSYPNQATYQGLYNPSGGANPLGQQALPASTTPPAGATPPPGTWGAGPDYLTPEELANTGVPAEPFPFSPWTQIPMLEQYGIGKGYEEDWAKKYGIVGQPIYQIPNLTYPYPETPIYPARHPTTEEGTFYEGLGTPDLPSYAGAQAEYPTYQPFESPLLSQLAGTTSQRMAGQGIGGTAAQEYQLAMQQIDQATQQAQQNLERHASAGGWIGAEAGTGLFGAEQGKIEQVALGQKATAATQFAIKDAEMRERAIESAMAQGMQLGDYGAQQMQLAYQSRANAWGETAADRFQQYQADLRKAEDEYGMTASQHEMQEEGKKLAWEAARDEATKQYESYVQAGMTRYQAEEAALAFATQQWQLLYASIGAATQRELDYARDIIGMEKDPGLQPKESMEFWDWLAMAAVSAAGGYATGMGAAAVASDIRLKKNIEPLNTKGSVLEKLESIEGIYFDWNDKYKEIGEITEDKQIGLIAQDVERIFPEAVSIIPGSDSNYRGIDYRKLIPVLLEAIKELNAKLNQIQGNKI